MTDEGDDRDEEEDTCSGKVDPFLPVEAVGSWLWLTWGDDTDEVVSVYGRTEFPGEVLIG